MAFDPHKYLIRVQGNRNYLPVAARLIWFREVHPDWGIETHIVKISDEFQSAIFRAEIKDETGRIIATSTKTENSQGFADFVEKAETGAIGRSLALCGFGTQFDPSLMEGEKIVDTPQGGNGEYQSEPQTQPRQAYQKTQSAPREDENVRSKLMPYASDRG
jgi:hypothetical protein